AISMLRACSQPSPSTGHARRIELLCGFDQIRRADDVVPIEHLARPPADHLHRDPFGDASAEEVANGGAAAVMDTPAGHSGPATRRAPCFVEAADRLPLAAREDVRKDVTERAFTITRHHPSPLEQRAELGREWEHAALAGLRGPRVEPDLA